jgi:Glycosyltransferase family 87
VSRVGAATVAGLAVLVSVAACSALAWQDDSPLVPRLGGTARPGSAWSFLVLLVLAFIAYGVGLALLQGFEAPPLSIAVLAVAIQLAPLGAPLLLSTDAWTYWDYGRIAAVHGGNPYADTPDRYPGDPAFAHMGAAWRGQTSVYGPAFTLASEPLARATGRSADAAAWLYKALAAVATLAAAALAGRLARRPAFAAAFVGWNPVLAVHFAGGGHNDAWVGAFVLAALALSARARVQAAGAAWVLAIALKWVPLAFLALRALAARATRRPVGHAGFALTALLLTGLATWRYGLHWLSVFAPLAGHAGLETRFALPHRLESVGVPRVVALTLAGAVLAVGLLWLARDASRGRPRLALAACLVLVTTPYLAVWYLGWVIPLAAAEEDRLARLAALGLCGYLLPQTIPL